MNTDRITGKGSEMRKHSEYYLTQESPFRALLIFSFPMMMGNLFQQFYTMTDSIIVGRFIGEAALAAVVHWGERYEAVFCMGGVRTGR